MREARFYGFVFTMVEEFEERSYPRARVRLHYDQHKGVPSDCFGETEYFVTQVEPVAP